MQIGTSQIMQMNFALFIRKLVFINALLHHLMHTGTSQVNTYELCFVHQETCVYKCTLTPSDVYWQVSSEYI